MASEWQAVLALDARYNAYRTPQNPNFRTLYIKRRSQLLKSFAQISRSRDYVSTRSQLLAKQFGVQRAQSCGVSLKSMRLPPPVLELAAPLSTQYLGSPRPSTGSSPPSAESYVEYQRLDQHSQPILRLKFAHNDRSRLAAACVDGTISICQVVPSPVTVVCQLKGHQKAVTDLDWSVTNDYIVSTSLDGSARMWHVAHGKCVRVFASSDPLFCSAFLPLNNSLFVVGTSKQLVQVYNQSTGKPVKGGHGKTMGRTQAVCFDGFGKILWAGDDRGFVTAFLSDAVQGKLIRTRRVSANGPVTSVSWHSVVSRQRRCSYLLVNSAVGELSLFSVTTGDGDLLINRRWQVPQSHLPLRSSFAPLLSSSDLTASVCGGIDNQVLFFASDSETPSALSGHEHIVVDATFNYDESLVASCDAAGTIIFWKRVGTDRSGSAVNLVEISAAMDMTAGDSAIMG